jgi:hypothetical protein
VKLFGWTTLHHKIPTADLLAARGMQPNPICPLCNSCSEDVYHLLTECAFTKGMLHHIWAWFHLHSQPPQDHQNIATWIKKRCGGNWRASEQSTIPSHLRRDGRSTAAAGGWAAIYTTKSWKPATRREPAEAASTGHTGDQQSSRSAAK